MLVPGIDGGGVGKIVLTYASRMDKNKFQIDVASLGTPDGHEPFHYKDLKKVCNSVIILNRNNYFRRFIQWIQLIKKGHYDIIHSHMDVASVPYLLIALLYGIKIRITQCHITTLPSTISRNGLKSLLKPLLRLLTTHKYACGLEAGKCLWGKDYFYIMHNAINIEIFKYNHERAINIKKIYLIPDNILVIGTVGRLTEQKNPFFLLDIIEALSKTIKFLFLWLGDGNMKNIIIEEIKKRQLGNFIMMAGNQANVGDWLSAMDVFILPSLYEGLPIVGVEAQCSGLKCLFSNEVTSEIGISKKCCFLPISDTSSWIGNICKFNAEIDTDRTSIEEIENSVYNINNAVHILENQYISFLSEN